MALCFYQGKSNKGYPYWGIWNRSGISIEDNIIKHCRKAFGKDYKSMWINPIYFDDKYFTHTEKFFSEVGIELYPKTVSISKELKRLGYKFPKPKTKAELEEQREEYKSIVWEIIHKDIDKSIRKGIKPINVTITGVRYKTKKGIHEKITSISVVKKLKEQHWY